MIKSCIHIYLQKILRWRCLALPHWNCSPCTSLVFLLLSFVICRTAYVIFEVASIFSPAFTALRVLHHFQSRFSTSMQVFSSSEMILVTISRDDRSSSNSSLRKLRPSSSQHLRIGLHLRKQCPPSSSKRLQTGHRVSIGPNLL